MLVGFHRQHCASYVINDGFRVLLLFIIFRVNGVLGQVLGGLLKTRLAFGNESLRVFRTRRTLPPEGHETLTEDTPRVRETVSRDYKTDDVNDHPNQDDIERTLNRIRFLLCRCFVYCRGSLH